MAVVWWLFGGSPVLVQLSLGWCMGRERGSSVVFWFYVL